MSMLLACILALLLSRPGDATGETSSAETSTAQASTVPSRAVSGPWAVAASTGSSYYPQEWMALLRAAGITTVRGISQDDRIAFDQERAAGFDASGILMWSPASQYRFPVNDLVRWRAYVKRMFLRFPEVDHWEVWNEPPNFTADTSASHYATLVRAADDVARSVAPRVRIGLSAKATDVRWLGDSIRAGARGHFDYVTVHPYERTGMLVTGTGESSFMAIVPQLRRMLDATAPEQRSVPIRFTEVGVALKPRSGSADGTVSANTAADVLVKAGAMTVAQGAEQFAWFDPWDGDSDGATSPAFGLVDRRGAKRPAYYAYARLVHALGTRPRYLGWVKRSDGSLAFAFASDGGKVVLVAWAAGGTIGRLSFGEPVRALGPRSGRRWTTRVVELTRSPVIVTASGRTAHRWAQLARADRPLAFNAGSRAQSSEFVRRVDWSPRSNFGGLTIVDSGRLTKVGGSRTFQARGAVTRFAVSPTFAAWRPTHIRVTARVYGLRGRPGFNLKYDSSRPLRDLDWAGQRIARGWTHVPRGTWTTVSWTIDDAAFVGRYGFTFRFDSDANRYSGYAIGAVTVSKLNRAKLSR